MEQGMKNIIKTFHRHSGKEGDPDTLSQKEFKDLVNKDMPNSLKKEKNDEKTMKHMMDDLDTNKDHEVSFDEFVKLLSKILIKDHKAFHEQKSSHGHGHSPRHGTDIRKMTVAIATETNQNVKPLCTCPTKDAQNVKS